MTLFIEDSPRPYQAGWIMDAVSRGQAGATVLSPWCTPAVDRPGSGMKPGLTTRASELRDEGVNIWFDPMTHALQMSGVGDFRYYSGYDLWSGPQGDLSTSALRAAHITKVFAIQAAIGAPHLAPTILLHTGLSDMSNLALALAGESLGIDSAARLTIAGSPAFWASGHALDAHVGALATLSPAGWFLAVARPNSGVPVAADPEEVHGLCRTVRALSEYAPVYISHGDLAGLPAIAAGAFALGTGWDQRQRTLSYPDYAVRDGGSGGGWYQRPTLRVLLGSITTNEAVVLRRRNASLAAVLGGLPAPGPKEAFFHHAAAISTVVTDLASRTDYRDRFNRLSELYETAAVQWDVVQPLVGSALGKAEWVLPVWQGLRSYGDGEGW